MDKEDSALARPEVVENCPFEVLAWLVSLSWECTDRERVTFSSEGTAPGHGISLLQALRNSLLNRPSFFFGYLGKCSPCLVEIVEVRFVEVRGAVALDLWNTEEARGNMTWPRVSMRSLTLVVTGAHEVCGSKADAIRTASGGCSRHLAMVG